MNVSSIMQSPPTRFSQPPTISELDQKPPALESLQPGLESKETEAVLASRQTQILQAPGRDQVAPSGNPLPDNAQPKGNSFSEPCVIAADPSENLRHSPEIYTVVVLISLFQERMDMRVQSKLPIDVLEQLNNLIDHVDTCHSRMPDKVDGNPALNQELNDLYYFFSEYCQKNKQDMHDPQAVRALKDRVGRIFDLLNAGTVPLSASDMASTLQHVGSGLTESEATAYILEGFEKLQTNVHQNELFDQNEQQYFLETTCNRLNTLSVNRVRSLGSQLKPVFVDATKLLEILINHYFTQGVNQERPLVLFNQLLLSKKIQNQVSRFAKQDFDALWQRFYTSQTGFHSLEGSTSIAVFIRETYTQRQLQTLFENIDFQRSKPNQHLKPLFDVFMQHNDDSRLLFIETMVASKKLLYFAVPTVISDVPTGTMLAILSQYCIRGPKSTLGYIQKHPAFLEENLKSGNLLLDHFHGTLNLTFLRNVRAHFHSVPPKYQCLFVRVVYFAALDTPRHAQLSGIEAQKEVESTAKFSEVLHKLATYTLLDINTFVASKLYKGSLALGSKSYVINIDYLTTVVSHVTSVPQDKLSELEQIRLTQGKQRSGKEAANGLIRQIFKGRDPFRWDVTSINDRVLYLYCFFKYPFETFRSWTESTNNSDTFYSQERLKHLFDTFDEQKKQVVGLDKISKYGYKYIQNNQLTTILAALSHAKVGKHFFAKLGTGQGKSLTLALLALQFAKENKRVMIFSCYDHLAKRDYRAFSELYADFGVKARYVDTPNPADLDAQVMYTNLDTFIKMYYANTNNLGKGEKDALADFPIFDIDVVLLDEFDALILDSRKIGNTVYNMKQLYPFGNFTTVEEARDGFKGRLEAMPGLRSFVNTGWSGTSFNEWIAGFSSQQGRVERNYLGNEVSYVGGEWYEMTRGHFYLYSSKIDVLTYLLSMPTVIGLSGSITENSMTRIKEAITAIDSRKELGYLNVPNFYGIEASRNREVTIKQNLSQAAWISAILADMEASQNRPIIVFGDINTPNNWDHLRQSLENYAAQNNRRFQVISDESQTEDMSMVYACDPNYITLASHIVGRGADFKIHPDIDAIGGAHVCVAAVPKNDWRLYMQMLGRVARMTNQGSHSVLLQGALPKEENDPIEISSFEKEINQVTRHVQKYLAEGYNQEQWRRWFLLVNMVIDKKAWPVSAASVEELSVALIEVVTEEKPGVIRAKFKNNIAPKPLLKSESGSRESCVLS